MITSCAKPGFEALRIDDGSPELAHEAIPVTSANPAVDGVSAQVEALGHFLDGQPSGAHSIFGCTGHNHSCSVWSALFPDSLVIPFHESKRESLPARRISRRRTTAALLLSSRPLRLGR